MIHAVLLAAVLLINESCLLQGLAGLEGPVGESGYDGCNGTKVINELNDPPYES